MREDGFPIMIEWNGEEYYVPSFEEIESMEVVPEDDRIAKLKEEIKKNTKQV